MDLTQLDTEIIGISIENDVLSHQNYQKQYRIA